MVGGSGNWFDLWTLASPVLFEDNWMNFLRAGPTGHALTME
jgi:hypothetical protein